MFIKEKHSIIGTTSNWLNSSFKVGSKYEGYFVLLTVSMLTLLTLTSFLNFQPYNPYSQLVFGLLSLTVCLPKEFIWRSSLYDKELITGNLDFLSDSFSKPLKLSKSRCDFDVKDDIMVNIGANGAYIETSASDFTKSNSIQSSFIGNLALDLCPIMGRTTVGNRFDFASQLTVASNNKSVVLTSYLVGPINDLFTINHTAPKQYPLESRSTCECSVRADNSIENTKPYGLRQYETIFSNPDSVTSAFTLSFNSTKSRRDFGSNDVTVSFGSGGTVTDTVANLFNKPVLELGGVNRSQALETKNNILNNVEYTSDWESVNSTVTISFNSTKSRRDFGTNDNTVSFGSGGTNTVPSPSLNTSSTTFKDYLKLYSYAEYAQSTARQWL